MKRYDTYKESGVEWIGEIPDDWKINKIKYLATVINGSTPDSGIDKYWDGDIDWVTPADISKIQDNYISNSIRKITEEGLNNCGTTLVPKGSVILTTRAPIGNVAIAGKELCTNQGCKSLLFKSNSNFYYYQFLAFKDQLEAAGNGSTFKELSTSSLKGFPFVMPSEMEKNLISSYLDKKAEQINQIIQQKELLLEKLQAKRQAIINEAVTKGLNPNVSMKPSSVEWLGDIPEHWEAKKLKYISPSISVGLVINPSSYYADNGEVPMITGKHVQPFKIDAGTAKKITKLSNDELWRSQIHYQDIVVVRVGYPGIAAVVTKGADGFNCASMMIVRKGDFNSDFLCYCFNSTIGKEQVSLVEYGAAQRQFNLSHAVNFIFPIPPIEEQRKIVLWLRDKFERFDVLNDKLIEQIEKLKLYRQSLISEVVTGKIKVV